MSDFKPIGSAFHESQSLEVTPERQASFRLAAGVRRIIEELVAHPTPTEDLDEAAALVEKVADLLGRQAGQRGYDGWAESANAGTPYAFFDNSPMIGLANPLAPPADLRVEANRVVGSVVFGSAYEGPPGHCHGGYLAATFDELLGMAQTLSGQSGMTGTLTVRYRRPTPLHRRIDLEAELVKVDGRKVTVAGRSVCDGQLTAESEGIFISMDATRFSRLMQARQEGSPGEE